MPSNAYTEAVEAVSEDPAVTPQLVHVQRWGDLMLAILDEPKVDDSTKTIIRNHVAANPVRDNSVPHVRMCQSQPFKQDAEMHVMQFCFSTEFHHIAAQVLKALVSAGGSIQFGAKPRTGLEWATQEALDAVRSFH